MFRVAVILKLLAKASLILEPFPFRPYGALRRHRLVRGSAGDKVFGDIMSIEKGGIDVFG